MAKVEATTDDGDRGDGEPQATVAGVTKEVAERLAGQGLSTTLDRLGENVLTRDEADALVTAWPAILDAAEVSR